jgi:uncharacterized iron-regulated membrane protein
MKMNLRKLHRQIAPILFIPLLLAALTGIAYRLGRSWFGIPEEIGELFLSVHEGRYFGKDLVPVYVLLVGLGLLGTVVSGIVIIVQSRKRSPNKPDQLNERSLHKFAAPIVLLPLAVSGITGVGYRVGKAWFGLPPEQAKILLSIHQGSYLGPDLRPIYVLLVGVGLVFMLITGIKMLGIFRNPPSLT